MKSAVINASPLIILGRAGYLGLLPKLFTPLHLPRGVAAEIEAGPADDPARRGVLELGLRRVDVAVPDTLRQQRLGQGETEVIAFAMAHPGTMVVLDDKAARRVARGLDLPLTGTLGILIAAAQSQLIADLSVALSGVAAAGLYIDPAVMAELRARFTRQ